MGAPPAWDPADDSSSLTATMEPPEGASDEKEPTLAADLTPEDDAAAAGPGIDGVPYAPAVTGYQLQPSYAPYLSGAGDAGYGGGRGDLWGSLRSFFGGGSGGWFGRRRLMSHRRSLLMSDGLSSEGLMSEARPGVQSGDRWPLVKPEGETVAQVTGSHATGGMAQQQQQQHQLVLAQQQQLRRLAAAAAAAAAPARPPAAPRRSQEAAGRGSSSGKPGSSRAGSGSGAWGRFSLAVTFPEKTQYRTLTPDLTKLEFTHTGERLVPGALQQGCDRLIQALPCMHLG
jgi:hypothetical protein